jgi:hypothetical protein
MRPKDDKSSNMMLARTSLARFILAVATSVICLRSTGIAVVVVDDEFDDGLVYQILVLVALRAQEVTKGTRRKLQIGLAMNEISLFS